jgi:hypothetical protein
MNRWSTTLRFSKRAKVDVITLFNRMGELGVPFSYCDELEEIYFTLLPHKHGQYAPHEIWLSTSLDSRGCIDRTLVHELGHHIDNVEELSERLPIIEEKRLQSKFMPDNYARQDVGEYIAVGFEVYYLGTREQRRKMRELNPRLYRTIGDVHRKYSKY